MRESLLCTVGCLVICSIILSIDFCHAKPAGRVQNVNATSYRGTIDEYVPKVTTYKKKCNCTRVSRTKVQSNYNTPVEEEQEYEEEVVYRTTKKPYGKPRKAQRANYTGAMTVDVAEEDPYEEEEQDAYEEPMAYAPKKKVKASYTTKKYRIKKITTKAPVYYEEEEEESYPPQEEEEEVYEEAPVVYKKTTKRPAKYTTKRAMKKKYTTTPAYEEEEEEEAPYEEEEEESYATAQRTYKKPKTVYTSHKSNSSYPSYDNEDDDQEAEDTSYGGSARNATYGSSNKKQSYNGTGYAAKQVTSHYKTKMASYDDSYGEETHAYKPATKTYHKAANGYHQEHYPISTPAYGESQKQRESSYLDEAVPPPNIITIHQNQTRETDLVVRLVTHKKSDQDSH